VAEDLRERDQRRHRVVDLVLGVLHEHLLGVGPADPGHARTQDDPVGTDGLRVLDLDEIHGCRRQALQQRVVVIAGLVDLGDRAGIDAEHEGFHLNGPHS